jgi:hypothetical protein
MHGAVPQRPARRRTPPSDSAIVTIRILLMLCSVVSCSMLSWAALFRLAYLRRRPVDWVVAVASVAVSLGMLIFVGSVPEESMSANVGVSVIVGLGIAVAVYYLVVDMRLVSRHRAGLASVYGYTVPVGPMQFPPQVFGVPPGPGHGRPHPAAGAPPRAATPPPATTGPAGPLPVPPPHAGSPVAAPSPGAPATPPVPQAPPERHRIDRVRAELDELSDLLRKGDSGGQGGPADGSGADRRGPR